MEGYEVNTMDNCAHLANIVVTTTGCKDIVKGEHFLKLKEQGSAIWDPEVSGPWFPINESQIQISNPGKISQVWKIPEILKIQNLK